MGDIREQDKRIVSGCFSISLFNHEVLWLLRQASKWKLHNFGRSSLDNFHGLNIKWSISYLEI